MAVCLPKKYIFSSITKWRNLLDILGMLAEDVALVAEIIDMPHVILDERYVNKVMENWQAKKQTFKHFHGINEVTSKIYVSDLIAEVPFAFDSMKVILELMISDRAFKTLFSEYPYSIFPTPYLQFEGTLDYAVVRHIRHSIPVFMAIEVTTSDIDYGRCQVILQMKSCYELARSLGQKLVEQSVLEEFEAETLAAIQERRKYELPPDLDPTARQYRTDLIDKQCRKAIARKYRAMSENRFREIVTRCPLHIYGLATTAKFWVFMRYDGVQFVERESITIQSVEDREHVRQVMTIMYRILERQKTLINTLFGNFR